MQRYAPYLGAILLFSSLAAAGRGAEPRDTADLFPAGTLAYLEFRQADRLSREVAGLLRGSALDDMPAALAKYRDQRGDNGNLQAHGRPSVGLRRFIHSHTSTRRFHRSPAPCPLPSPR